ncbi:MAG: hypothetical protein RLZZ282_639 [Verrucomicrobiota bacterium]
MVEFTQSRQSDSTRMKIHPYVKMLALVGSCALVSCATQPQTAKVPVSKLLGPSTSLTTQVFQRVNDYRRTKGTTQLQRHSGLDGLAQQHCEYLRQHRGSFSLSGKNVSHIGFDGRALAAQRLYRIENLSENVAALDKPGSQPAPALIRAWIGSKDHHKNMLENWTHAGVGLVVDSDGMVFATALFATVSYSQSTERDRFNRF